VRDSKLRLPKPTTSTHPVDVGHRTEAAIVYALIRRGYRVLLPAGVNQRYDLGLDLDGVFLRAQCKTGRYRNGAIEFATRSTRANTVKCVSKGYRGEVEVFLVHCPEFDAVYCVPIAEAPACGMSLRVDPSRNGQSDRVNWARDYELPG
jgi:PD-(D/E)XK endonuclease